MTRDKLASLREIVLKKFVDYLNADQNLAEESSPGGFIDKSHLDKLRKAYEEWKIAEGNWQNALREFAATAPSD